MPGPPLPPRVPVDCQGKGDTGRWGSPQGVATVQAKGNAKIISRRHFVNNRLAGAGPGIEKGGPRRIGRPAATPGDHPELHSETAFSNGNAGCAPAQTAVETSRRFCGSPQSDSRERPERAVPRRRGAVPGRGHSRPFPLAWAPAFPATAPWLNARTSAIGLRGCAVVVGSAGGGARRPWTETVLSGGGSVSPCRRDPGGAAETVSLAFRPIAPRIAQGFPDGVAPTASGDRKELTLRSPQGRRRREDDAPNAGRRVTDFRGKLPETLPGLDLRGLGPRRRPSASRWLATPVESPAIVSPDPDATATQQIPKGMSNVSTAHTGRGRLGPPGPGRAIGGAA